MKSCRAEGPLAAVGFAPDDVARPLDCGRSSRPRASDRVEALTEQGE